MPDRMTSNLIELNVPGGTHRSTCPARHAYICLDMVRGIYLDIHSPPGQAYSTVPYPLAHACAKAAQDTITVFRPKAWLLYAVLRGQFLDNGYPWTSCEQELDI